MPKSFLEVEGLYNPTLRFAFTNITEEEFISKWDGIPIKVQPRETIEISNVTPIPGAGHAIAIKMTTEMVDKIIIGQSKLDEIAKNQPYYRDPKAMSLGVPAVRKVWEDQILRQLDPEEESPALQQYRKQLLQDMESGNATQKVVENPVFLASTNEFAELKPGGTVAPMGDKPPATVKKVGRPVKATSKV